MTNLKTILFAVILTFTLKSWSQNSPFETKAFNKQQAFNTYSFDNRTTESQNTYQTLSGGDPGGDPDAPIDSGILFLLSAGLIYVSYKFLHLQKTSVPN